MDKKSGYRFLEKTTSYDARFAIYLPDTRSDRSIFTQEEFDICKEHVINVLAKLFHGATAMPPTDARWVSGDDTSDNADDVRARMMKEKTTVVYSFCTQEDLKANEDELDKLIDYVGSVMQQEAVAVEIASIFYLRKFSVA